MPRTKTKPGKGKQRCRMCDAVISSGYRNCPKCGAWLRGEAAPASDAASGRWTGVPIVNGKVGEIVPAAGPAGPARRLTDPADSLGSHAASTVAEAVIFSVHCGGVDEAMKLLESLKSAVEKLG